MPLTSSPWLSGQRAGFVSLGSHCLYLSADEPQRSIIQGRLQPAVIIEAGLGSGLSEWVAVSRLIAQRARVYSYDRAGYRRSEPSPNPQYTAINRNRELATLLEVAEIEPTVRPSRPFLRRGARSWLPTPISRQGSWHCSSRLRTE
ncbi:hypothetical protein ASPBRDRAFT_675403 [Aspergillus brasiliensis CBS 101740]|uniref:AB hydrolase-1 domain-containing protein n=1 Tax=Aspergillus brasiliensis (strain CBS 101740 / IMI 381727 / IBT 21946) TaxID=767769 RepID=A0A1L9UKS2_ASPBC|nr:hypothetical protein ASPBRDRAFT_675403 [Aspergillus brasiliensis CBS 101740]